MKTNITVSIHPVIAALEERHDAAVMIRGYLGTSSEESVRLYETLDTSDYIEVPKEAVLLVEEEKGGESGAVRAFVRSSSEMLTVQRQRIRVSDWPPRLPPPRPRPTFWTCAAGCETRFVDLAIRIIQDETTNLLETDHPEVQEIRRGELERRKTEAKRALYFCLSNCLARYGPPPGPWMIVPDPSAPSGFRVESFTLGAYHTMLVARYLEKPE